MFPGVIRSFQAVSAVALIAAATLGSSASAIADPGQDQRFFDLLGQKEIPPVDNANSLITSARHACEKLDAGMPVGDLVELVRTNGFNDNPLARLQPQDRVTRTIDQFINAAVEAYCPHNKGKIASIAAYRAARTRVHLVSLSIPIHAGEIAPTKPLPVPVQPPPPVPQELQPAPEQPPPPRRVPPAPPQVAPQEPVPPAEVPGGSPDGGSGGPGGDMGGGNAPAPQTPDQPAPPGHIRLAP